MHDRFKAREITAARRAEITDRTERAYLGALMIAGASVLPRILAGRLVDENDFARPEHRETYRALLALHGRGIDPDLVLVLGELDATDCVGRAGGITYVASILDVVPDVENAEHYARHIRAQATVRRVARLRH